MLALRTVTYCTENEETPSQGIAQVSTAMHQLDQMTQQNSALVEESTAAAASLREQAMKLTDVVALFRVQAGEVQRPRHATAPTRAAAPAARADPCGTHRRQCAPCSARHADARPHMKKPLARQRLFHSGTLVVAPVELQSACLRRKAGISSSSMPPEDSASTRAVATERLVRQTLGTAMLP